MEGFNHRKDQLKKALLYCKRYQVFQKLAVFILVFGIFCYVGIKNIESRANAYLQARDFKGKLKVTGINPFSANWNFYRVKVNYIYSETVNGRQYQIPIVREHQPSELLFPFVPGDEWYLGRKDTVSIFADFSIFTEENIEKNYGPIVYQALESQKDFKPIEKKYQIAFEKDPTFKQAKVKLKLIFDSRLYPTKVFVWLGTEMKNNIQKGQTAFGGAGALKVEEAIKENLLYVDISFPEKESRSMDIEKIKEELKRLNEKTPLPDGLYRINGNYGGFILENGEIIGERY